MRVFPTSDPSKALLYTRLIEDSLKISSLGLTHTHTPHSRLLCVHTSLVCVGRNYSAQSNRASSSLCGHGQSIRGRGSGCGLSVVRDMEEPELLDILSQYEDEDGPHHTPPWHSVSKHTHTRHMTIT